MSHDLNLVLTRLFTEDELMSLSLSLSIPSIKYSFNYQSELAFMSASTIKVLLNMYIYDLASKNPSLLKSEIEYQVVDYEDGAGVLQDSEFGSLFSVQTLLHYSIVYSDNIAANMLYRTFIDDLSTCEELIPYFGEADYFDWTSTALNRMQALNYLYSNQSRFSILLSDMSITIYRDRLPSLLPSTVTVALKTGDIDSTIHDYAIVFDTSHVDYLIVISMDGNEDQDERMAILSKEVYDLIQSKVHVK